MDYNPDVVDNILAFLLVVMRSVKEKAKSCNKYNSPFQQIDVCGVFKSHISIIGRNMQSMCPSWPALLTLILLLGFYWHRVIVKDSMQGQWKTSVRVKARLVKFK